MLRALGEQGDSGIDLLLAGEEEQDVAGRLALVDLHDGVDCGLEVISSRLIEEVPRDWMGLPPKVRSRRVGS